MSVRTAGAATVSSPVVMHLEERWEAGCREIE